MFQLLRDAATGTQVNLPDPSHILPYLDLYTLVVLNPTPVTGLAIITSHLPPLSIFKNGQFQPAKTRASQKNWNIAWTFEPITTAANNPLISLGNIMSSIYGNRSYIPSTCRVLCWCHSWQSPVYVSGVSLSVISTLQHLSFFSRSV